MTLTPYGDDAASVPGGTGRPTCGTIAGEPIRRDHDGNPMGLPCLNPTAEARCGAPGGGVTGGVE